MGDCNHEVADTTMVVYLIDSLEKDCRKVVICTVDTEVVLISIGVFHEIHEIYPATDI